MCSKSSVLQNFYSKVRNFWFISIFVRSKYLNPTIILQSWKPYKAASPTPNRKKFRNYELWVLSLYHQKSRYFWLIHLIFMTFLKYIFALFKNVSEVLQLDARKSQKKVCLSLKKILMLTSFLNKASFKSWAKPTVFFLLL